MHPINSKGLECSSYALSLHALPRCELSPVEELVHIKLVPSFKHKIDGSAEFSGKDRQGFALAVLAHQPVVMFLAPVIALQEETGAFREGPFQMHISDFGVT